jgi:periplasmic protein TonB
MFDQLVSSKVKRESGPVRGLVVGMLHGIMIAGAIRVTARPPEPPAASPMVMPVIYRTHRAPVTSAPAPSDPTAPVIPVDAPSIPTPTVDVPPSIPPVVPGPPIDAATIRRILSSGVPGVPGGRDSVAIGGVLEAATVDDPAAVVHQPSPRYPPALQQAGLEGRVLVEFVIDTTGHTEGASLRVLESSHPGFEAAARETIRRSVFRPARVKGTPVRQRTVQAVTFRILPD